MIILAIILTAGTLFAGLGISYFLDSGLMNLDLLSVTKLTKEPTLIIEAQTVQGHPLSMYVYVGNQSGYTPFKFYETGHHNVTASNYESYVFKQWDAGSRSLSNIIELNDNTKTITAIYQ